MNCFTLYWNKLGILTWSVSWAADNEQLRDSTNLNLYSCLKGMSMTIFQNLPYPCEIDKYANNTPLPRLGFPTTHVRSAAAIQIPGQTWGQKAGSALTASTLQLISPSGAGSSTTQVHFPLELLPPSSSWQTLQVLFFYNQLWGWFYCCPESDCICKKKQKQPKTSAKTYHRGSPSSFMNAHVNVLWHERLHKWLIQAPSCLLSTPATHSVDRLSLMWRIHTTRLSPTGDGHTKLQWNTLKKH